MAEDLSGNCYVVHTRITAVKYRQDGGSRFVTIPPGAAIVVKGQLKEFDIVEIEYEEEILAVFSRDIVERAERRA